MIITYFGDGCFRLQSGDTTLLVDPNSNRLKADVVLKTLVPANVAAAPATEFAFPGEYESKGMTIIGSPVATESTEKFLKNVFVVEWEEMTFAFLGHLSRMAEPDIIERIGEPDILFFPFDGKHFLSADGAAKLIKQIGPRVVIPSFGKNPDEVMKALGQKTDIQDKFVFKKKDLEGKQSKLVVLKSG